MDMAFIDFVVLQNNIKLTFFLLFNIKGSSLNKYLLRAFCVHGLPSNGEIHISQLQIMKI